MKSYMLTRVYEKKCTHEGVRKVSRPNGLPDIIEYVVIPFEPKKISKVDEEIDMSAPVDAGFIVEVAEPIIEVPDPDVLGKDCGGLLRSHEMIVQLMLDRADDIEEEVVVEEPEEEAIDELEFVEEETEEPEELVDEEPVEPEEDEEEPAEEPIEGEPEVEEHGDDEPLEVEVGIMIATVDPGEDGELNTDDDIVEISRKVVEEDELEDEECEEDDEELEDDEDEEELEEEDEELSEDLSEDEDDEDEDEEDEEEEESSDIEYEKLANGSFLCLKCKSEGDEKILKTELGMIKHIQDKH